MNSQIDEKIGVLLVNLGTPKSTSLTDIKSYLKQFLSDPYVIDIPSVFRWFLVNVIILNFRPKKSQHAYKSIWTPQGSPLLTISTELKHLIKNEFSKRNKNWEVSLGMRYGDPSIESSIKELMNTNVKHIVFVPLYPQFALSSTTTAEKEVFEILDRLRLQGHPTIHNGAFLPFFNHPAFIQALVESIARTTSQVKFDHILFSYHGLPERHIHKTKEIHSDCLNSKNCCDEISQKNTYCYKAHSFATTRAIAKELKLEKNQYSTAFQSRLGNTPWIQPYTDQEIIKLAKSGVKKLAIICPSFVTDCLETLEEINLRGRELFLENGGQEFYYIPCLNTDQIWIEALADIIEGVYINAPQNNWTRFLN